MTKLDFTNIDYNLTMANSVLDDWKMQQAEIVAVRKLVNSNDTFEINFGCSLSPENIATLPKNHKYITLIGKDNLQKIIFVHSERLNDNDLKIIAKRLITFLCIMNKKVSVGHSSTPFIFAPEEKNESA